MHGSLTATELVFARQGESEHVRTCLEHHRGAFPRRRPPGPYTPRRCPVILVRNIRPETRATRSQKNPLVADLRRPPAAFSRPTHAGVDPYNYYIDRNSGDDVRQLVDPDRVCDESC